MSRQSLLLCLVAILLVARFVVVPAGEYIEQLRDEADALTVRLSKAEQVIARRTDIEAKSAEVSAMLGKSKQQFPLNESTDVAKIAFQKQLETIASKHNVTLQSQEWLNVVQGNPEVATVEIRLTAHFPDLAAFQLEIESIGTWIVPAELDMRVANQKVRRKLLGTAQGKLTYKLFYMVGG